MGDDFLISVLVVLGLPTLLFKRQYDSIMEEGALISYENPYFVA